MKLATWNVNSLRARMGWVEEWLRTREPDVLLMQETKLADAEFPESEFAALGYQSACHGNGRWNGVAILSRVGLEDVQVGFRDDEAPPEECRIIAANCGGVRVFSAYVPNGRTVGSEFYDAKLVWLSRLRNELVETCAPESPIALCGDFNIAPEDIDVYDITQFDGMTHVTPEERKALTELLGWGLVDALRVVHPDGPGPFSWWDYRAGAFHKGWGMRIDLVLLSSTLARHVTDVQVDREARKVFGVNKPSDHAPVIAELDLAP